ncbi:MAG: hypothetical protein HKN12_05345, partial [Gemmatimonadetes bacterium]|nr:hypothetical protein [Gemmatimonadota bacterium]
RAAYGILVLLGLLGSYVLVLDSGRLPVPSYGIGLFALLYLPFLSQRFIDLDLTDSLARHELEVLLLGRDFRELQNASGQDVLKQGRRKLRIHWEAHRDEEGLVVELDVHPSLFPVTVSRPHIATVRDQTHLERIRDEIRRRRAHGEDPDA